MHLGGLNGLQVVSLSPYSGSDYAGSPVLQVGKLWLRDQVLKATAAKLPLPQISLLTSLALDPGNQQDLLATLSRNTRDPCYLAFSPVATLLSVLSELDWVRVQRFTQRQMTKAHPALIPGAS